MILSYIDDLFEKDVPPEFIYFCSRLHFPFLIFIFIFLLCIVLYLLYAFIFKPTYGGKWIHYVKLLFIIGIIIVLLILLLTDNLVIQVVSGGENTGVIFTLALTIMMMPYMNAVLTGEFKIESKLLLYTLFAIITYVAVSDFGQVGIRVIFDFDLDIPFVFSHKTFQSNSHNGILFITANIGLWLAIFVASFSVEFFS